MPAPLAAPRMLLCACPLHCIQVLHLAGHASKQDMRHMQDLQTCTQWPIADSGHAATNPDISRSNPLHILWALLPADAPPAAKAREAAWRQRLQQFTSNIGCNSIATIQMLYGSAAQQAQQLRPWIHQRFTESADTPLPDCQECLDAHSEQALFSRLIRT